MLLLVRQLTWLTILPQALTVSSGVNIEADTVIDTAADIIYSDGTSTDDDTGVINVELNVVSTGGDLTLNTGADTTDDLAVPTAPGSFTLTGGDTDDGCNECSRH